MEFGMPVFELAALDPEFLPKRLVDEKLIGQHHPLSISKRSSRLFVAISNPLNQAALDEIKFHTGMRTEPVLVEADKLAKMLDSALAESDALAAMKGLTDADLENLNISADSDVDDTSVVRFVNKVLLDAVNKKTSDIDFERYEKSYRMHFLLYGILQ
jgi:type IV pilus assembly protein PilB